MNQTESKITHLTEHEQLIQAANTARKDILEKQKEPERKKIFSKVL